MTALQNSIHLTDITQELQKIWNAELGKKRIRASLFTLIFYVQKTERVSFYENLVKSVLTKFPCRVILIVYDGNKKEDYLKTSVSAQVVGDSPVYCELIQIEVAGKLIERVPFILLPHILPDLPVYLLWNQDPMTENTVFPCVEPFANRIIFDSESTSDLQLYSHSILSLMNRFHCAIGDLHWSAISGWRRIFAQVFGTQETFLSLAQSKIIQIYFNQSGVDFHRPPEIESCYLQAWIAACLNWKVKTVKKEEGNIRLTYHRPLDEVVIQLIPGENTLLPPGAILSIEMESVQKKGHYVFKRHPQSRQVFIQYSDKERCDLPYSASLSGTQEGQEIIEEIFYPSGTKHYRAMLESLSTIPWSEL